MESTNKKTEESAKIEMPLIERIHKDIVSCKIIDIDSVLKDSLSKVDEEDKDDE